MEVPKTLLFISGTYTKKEGINVKNYSKIPEKQVQE